MKKLIHIVLFSGIISSVFPQEQQTKSYSKLSVMPSTGLNLPLTKLFSGQLTDNLFGYDDNSYYWQLAANYFFSPTIGIELTFQAGHSSNISDRGNKFTSEIEKKYGDKYHLTISSSIQYDNISIVSRGYLGFVYRFEKSKFNIVPKILIGVTSFYTDYGNITLKEKGTNTVLLLSYRPNKMPHDHFTLAPAITFGYRLSNRILVNIDLLYSFYQTNIVFTEETRNAFTNETQSKKFNYHKSIHTMTMGLGLIIELKRVPIKSNL